MRLGAYRLSAFRRFIQLCLRTQFHLRAALRDRGPDGRLPKELMGPRLMTWSRECLALCNVDLERIGPPPADTPSFFIGNHLSYVDIVALGSQFPVVFVAKKEIQKWPVFGAACDSVHTVWVSRDSSQSRNAVSEVIAKSILAHKQSIAIFPAGTTSLTETKPWRWGVFHIAHKYGIPVQPYRLRYHPPRTVAFIDDDWLATHMIRLMSLHEPIRATIEFHPPVLITNPEEDCLTWWEWTREGL